jgi:hypothetical protein
VPFQSSAGALWSPDAVEIGTPPGSSTAPEALTRAPYTSRLVPERKSCHVTSQPEPFEATAGARWFPAAVETAM